MATKKPKGRPVSRPRKPVQQPDPPPSSGAKTTHAAIGITMIVLTNYQAEIKKVIEIALGGLK